MALRQKLVCDLEIVDDQLAVARLRGAADIGASSDDAGRDAALCDVMQSLKKSVVDLSSMSGVEAAYRLCRKCHADPATFHAAFREVQSITERWKLLPATGGLSHANAASLLAAFVEGRPHRLSELADAVLECVIAFEMHAERVVKHQRAELEELASHERALSAILGLRFSGPLSSSSSSSVAYSHIARGRHPTFTASAAAGSTRIVSASPSSVLPRAASPSIASAGSSRLQFFRPPRGVSPSARGPSSSSASAAAGGHSAPSSARPSPHRVVSVSPCRVVSGAGSMPPERYGTGSFSHSTVPVPSHKSISGLQQKSTTSGALTQHAPPLSLGPKGDSGASAAGHPEDTEDWDCFVEHEVQSRQARYEDRPVVQAPRYSDPSDPIHQAQPSAGAMRPHRTARRPQETHTLRVTFN